jgi:hypothetical protein
MKYRQMFATIFCVFAPSRLCEGQCSSLSGNLWAVSCKDAKIAKKERSPKQSSL